MKKCNQCGKKIDLDIAYLLYLDNHNSLSFCSKECRKKYLEQMLQEKHRSICELCKSRIKNRNNSGVEFINKTQGIKKTFCSKECRNKWIYKVQEGEINVK